MSRRLSRYLVLFCLSLLVVLPASSALAKTKSKSLQVGPRTWVVYIQRFDVGGQSGMWPESTTTSGMKRNMAWLHRNNGDKIQFVITSGADVCHLVWDDGSPLVPLGNPNSPADTINVYPTSSDKNGLYVVSPKLKLDKNSFCQYWFHIVGNPPCTARNHTCDKGTPPPPAHQDPCWSKDKPLQIGPGMDISD